MILYCSSIISTSTISSAMFSRFSITGFLRNLLTAWISCQAWRQAADYICNYAKKGALLAVDGRLQTRSYDNSSGQKVHVTEVVCERVEIQRQASSQSSGKQQTRSSQGYQHTDDGGFANNYTSTGYQDPFANDYGSGPTLDISSDDLPF